MQGCSHLRASLILRQCPLQGGRISITRRLADRQLELQVADFLIDQVDVHRLLTGRLAQFVEARSLDRQW